MAVKYVFVTGGVVSGLGKGITAASLGRLLKARGFRVTMQKFDPYINIDPGTMNPIQHGEVFVTDDGTETDLDLGHYERFIDESLDKNSNVTTGKVYWSVLQKERHGDYGGGTVQVIPHITNEIKSRFYRNPSESETHIAIIEVGGTVGDIESQPFLESIRQFQHDVGHENAILIHVTLIPYLSASQELKTKPTQASVKDLQGMGLQPDIIVCRSERPLNQSIKDKISLFCNVPSRHVLQNLDVEYLYEAPLAMERERLAQAACECLHLDCPEPDLADWEKMVDDLKHPTDNVQIALVGKYVALHDAYISVAEALKHGGITNHATIHIKWINSETVTAENAEELLSDCSGILVPGGFGSRGIDGKIHAINYARTHNVPFLGLCLGMQLTIVEYARNVLGFTDAHSIELDPSTTHPVIALMPDQNGVVDIGGTLRLGAYPCVLDKESRAYEFYGTETIYERHRHRYEVNNDYRAALTEKGMRLSGLSPDGRIVEMCELTEHPFFVATQAHPELKSRPNRPHPLFRGFVAAALEHKHCTQGKNPALPTRQEAEELLREAEQCNPGPWGNHSRVAAHCAEMIAQNCEDLDAEKAYILGLLHDIGRKFGVRHLGHVSDGYSYMMSLGYDEVARVCLTHSFHNGTTDDYIGNFDTTDEELQLIQDTLKSISMDEYDRLIQLCDSLAGAEGVLDIEDRMADVKRRYGFYPQAKWDANLALKKHFEEKMGKDIYTVVGKK